MRASSLSATRTRPYELAWDSVAVISFSVGSYGARSRFTASRASAIHRFCAFL
jgi:hypothetical protein